MIEEKQEEQQEEQEETQEQKQPYVFKGRPRPVEERIQGTKQLDLTGSAQLFEKEFYYYWPDPKVDLTEYEQDDGSIDVHSVPPEHLIEFTCRYIDSGTFQEILKTPLSYDLPKDKTLTQEEVENVIRKSIEDRLNNPKSDDDIRHEVLLTCVIDPNFQSTDQIKKILPLSLQMDLYNEIIRGAIGDNLVSRFQESN